MRNIVKTLKAIFLSEFVQGCMAMTLFLAIIISIGAVLFSGIDYVTNIQECYASSYQEIENLKKESTDPKWHKYLSDAIAKHGRLRVGEYKQLLSMHEEFKKQKMMEGFK